MGKYSIAQYKKDFLEILNPHLNNDGIDAALWELDNRCKPIRKHLYRYRRYNKFTRDEILKNHIYLCKPEKLDDIYDCRFVIPDLDEAASLEKASVAYDFLKFCADKFTDNEEINKNIRAYEAHFEKINTFANDYFRIACFTENNNNVPMWYYYAKKHTGICIEYDVSSTIEPLIPVIYPDYKEGNKYRCCDFNKDCELVTLYRNALVKNKDWAFEKEWRMIGIGEPGEDGMLLPVKIKKVYLGCQKNGKRDREIISLKKKHNLEFEIYRMVNTGVRLEAEKIM